MSTPSQPGAVFYFKTDPAGPAVFLWFRALQIDAPSLPANSLPQILSGSLKLMGQNKIQSLKTKIKQFENETEEPFNWSRFQLPNSEIEAKSILDNICSYLYNIKDIEIVENSFLNKNGKNSEIDYGKYKELIFEIGKETELIYKEIKIKVGFSDKLPHREKKRMEVALNYFKNNLAQFNKLKEIHLKDISLYIFGTGQSKRDFMRRLFKTTLDNSNPALSFSGDKAYRFFREIIKEKQERI